jgi:hypothetical protein
MSVVMDERRELRIETDQLVRITMLDESAAEFDGRIVNHSRTGLGVFLDRSVPTETPLKIVWDNRLLLGEVCYCRPEAQGFSAGVCLAHALFNTDELANLARRLLGDTFSDSQVTQERS